MNFREALAEVSRQPTGPNGSFLTYSTLCDRCGDRPDEVRKIELFYQIDKQLSLVYRIQSEGRSAVPDLLAAYPTLTTDQPIGEPQYRRLIEVAAAVILHQEPPPAPAKKSAAPRPAAVVRHRAPKPQTPAAPSPAPEKSPAPAAKPAAPKPKRAVVTPAPQPPAPPPTPLNASSAPSPLPKPAFWVVDGTVAVAAVLIACLVRAFVGAVTLPTFANWLIGVGAALLLGFLGLLWSVDAETGLLSGVGVLVADGILALGYGRDVRVIAACIAMVVCLYFILQWMVYRANEWRLLELAALSGTFGALTVFLAVIGFPAASPWIVGVAFAGFYAAVFYTAYDELCSGECALVGILTIVVLVVNAVLLAVLKTDYRIIALWISGTCLVFSGYHIYHCFDDYEEGWGVLGIVNAVAALCSILSVVPSFSAIQPWFIGAAAAAVYGVAAWLIYDNCTEECAAIALTTLAILAVNAALLFWLKTDYRIIFVWISGACLGYSCYHAHYCFDDYEAGWGVTAIAEAVAALCSILSVVLSFSAILPWFIGAAAAAVYGVAAWLIYDNCTEECAAIALTTLAILAVNAVLLFWLKTDYRIIFVWISGACLACSCFHACYCFDDYEAGWGVTAIAEAIAAVAGIVLSFVLL